MSPKVLVVDDDLSFATYVCGRLDAWGVVSEVALTGADALQRLSRGRWDGVLLDVRLPDADGLDVLGQLRAAKLRMPVVMVTGAGSVQIAVEAMRRGAMDFIEKPMSVRVLQAAVAKLTEPRLSRATDRPTDRPTDRRSAMS